MRAVTYTRLVNATYFLRVYKQRPSAQEHIGGAKQRVSLCFPEQPDPAAQSDL